MSLLPRPTTVSLSPSCSRPQDVLPTQGDPRGRFYEDYRKEAEEYDREFMKKYDEDLNTTLIFVSFVWFSGVRMLTRSQAGLFSAVTSAFILDVQSQLQPDMGEETAALLRVLIYKIDNTTFGNDPPTLPQWTGPSHTIVQVQAILFASLAASLLSAFLAMLGKQWLNRYASTDMRGTAIERSQNRQRKLDGIVAWYFDHVMESLPLMLQIALLLLGCALSRYLWGISTTVASVVLGVTSFGIIFYLFIVVAGTVSESCPYQTPGARIFRHVFGHILLPALRSAPSAISERSIAIFSELSSLMQDSVFHHAFIFWWLLFKRPWYSPTNIIPLSQALLALLVAPVVGAWSLGIGIPLLSVFLFGRTIYRRFMGASPQIMLDLRCISWMLKTSLDKAVHLSTLKHLELLISTPTDFDPALVGYCFDAFVGCIGVRNCEVVVVQGLEQLAIVSALCFFHTISHLSVMDPTSSALKDVGQRYARVFPANIDFCGHRFSNTMNAIHRVFIQSGERRHYEWSDYKPPSNEHTIVAQALVRLVRFKYQRMRQGKVPRFVLRFALHSLSLDPPPPTSVVADCLSIIAIDLGCDASDTEFATLNERYVHTSRVAITLTLNQCTGGASFEPGNLESQHSG